MKAFLVKRFGKFSYFLLHDARGIPVLFVGGIAFMAVVTAATFLITKDVNALSIAILISGVGLIGLTLAASPLGNLYAKTITPAKYVQEIEQIKLILQKHGSLPAMAIYFFAPKKLKGQLSLYNILSALQETEELITENGIVSLRQTIGEANAEHPPLPVDADYIAGYYQMYNRLKLIRETPELASIPLEMLDELYGTKVAAE
jgi:hypothetical protein